MSRPFQKSVETSKIAYAVLPSVEFSSVVTIEAVVVGVSVDAPPSGTNT